MGKMIRLYQCHKCQKLTRTRIFGWDELWCQRCWEWRLGEYIPIYVFAPENRGWWDKVDLEGRPLLRSPRSR